MKIRINYLSTKWYRDEDGKYRGLGYWLFYFKNARDVRAVTFRFCGVNVYIAERNATEKLITMIKNRMQK